MNNAKAAIPMRVTDIDISDLHFSKTGKQHRAYVSMTITREGANAPLQLQFLCRAEQPEACPSSLVTRDMIQDALRQAHRMPGFRRGEQRIEVEISNASVAARATSA